MLSVKTFQNKKIDYQKALRDFANNMVHLRRPERLLKMITAFIDRDLGLSHTSLLVYERQKKRYVFAESRGVRRFPPTLVKIEMNHPLILWFRHAKNGGIGNDYVSQDLLRKFLSRRLSKSDLLKKEVRDVMRAMHYLRIELAVPAYYKRTLQGLLLFGKKRNLRPFTESEISFFQILAQDCSMAIKTAEYHGSLIRQNQERARQIREVQELRTKERKTFYQIMRSLAQEIYTKDPSSFGHISQVEHLGILTARELGLDLGGRSKDILSAGLILHDVGKIGIPDHILQKPTALNEEEWKMMKTHVEKGASILDHLSDFKEAAEIVKSHHENFDGSGYPRGLKGEQISIQARIVSVVDAFHAIVSNRCYRKGKPVEEAFRELKRCAGTQFDPQVVEAFIRAIKKEIKKKGAAVLFDALTVKSG